MIGISKTANAITVPIANNAYANDGKLDGESTIFPSVFAVPPPPMGGIGVPSVTISACDISRTIGALQSLMRS